MLIMFQNIMKEVVLSTQTLRQMPEALQLLKKETDYYGLYYLTDF